MRHKSENTPRFITDCRNRIERTVRVGGKFRGRSAVAIGISGNYEILFFNPAQYRLFRHKLTLSVTQRQTDHIHAAGENTGRFRIYFEFAPVVAEHSGIVMRKRALLNKIFAVKRRHNTEPGQGLETIADTDNQLAVGNKLLQLLMKFEIDAVGENCPRAQMVAESESAEDLLPAMRSFKCTCSAVAPTMLNAAWVSRSQFSPNPVIINALTSLFSIYGHLI